MAIWFSYLATDWMTLRRQDLKQKPFVFGIPDHGRLVITASNQAAEKLGIFTGMVAADAKSIYPELEVIDHPQRLEEKLLKAIAKWGIRYTPFISMDLPDGLILDISGCSHLWSGEANYLREILNRIRSKGYHVRAAIADTPGTAWAVSRYGKSKAIVESRQQADALLTLPPEALRLEKPVLDRLRKLGFRSISNFISIPGSVLRRRFGPALLLRLDQALGNEEEYLNPLIPQEPYQERLASLEPIRTVTGIEIALNTLILNLCKRLQKEGKGLRTASFRCFRIDGKMVQIEIGTNRATHHVSHIFKLFQLKISSLEPALGIELFLLEAAKVEDLDHEMESLWMEERNKLDDSEVAELLDRISGKVGIDTIHRYLPDEHFWPERSIKTSLSLKDKPKAKWRTDKPRPMLLLRNPQRIDVSAPIPDYPPMLFRYRNKVHHIRKADGPERIEREWWMDPGDHRDYYTVEDEDGNRYWLFRSGHYSGDDSQWFIHGFFA